MTAHAAQDAASETVEDFCRTGAAEPLPFLFARMVSDGDGDGDDRCGRPKYIYCIARRRH